MGDALRFRDLLETVPVYKKGECVDHWLGYLTTMTTGLSDAHRVMILRARAGSDSLAWQAKRLQEGKPNTLAAWTADFREKFGMKPRDVVRALQERKQQATESAEKFITDLMELCDRKSATMTWTDRRMEIINRIHPRYCPLAPMSLEEARDVDHAIDILHRTMVHIDQQQEREQKEKAPGSERSAEPTAAAAHAVIPTPAPATQSDDVVSALVAALQQAVGQGGSRGGYRGGYRGRGGFRQHPYRGGRGGYPRQQPRLTGGNRDPPHSPGTLGSRVQCWQCSGFGHRRDECPSGPQRETQQDAERTRDPNPGALVVQGNGDDADQLE